MFTENHKLMIGGNIFGYFTDRRQTEDILQKARDLGIRAIDTADVYSETVSETYIGDILQQDRKDWFIASKVGIKSHASSDGLGKRETIFRKIEGSLKRLKTDYLDLYQLHIFDKVTPLEETLKAFEDLIREGKILSAGISNFSLNELKKLVQVPSHPIRYHQMAFNITNYHTNRELIQLCASQNISIIAYASLVRGLFNEKYLTGLIPEGSRAEKSQNIQSDLTPDFLEKLRRTADLAQNYNTHLTQIALQWLNICPSVEWFIVGCRNSQQLEDAFYALINAVPSSLLEEVQSLWAKQYIG